MTDDDHVGTVLVIRQATAQRLSAQRREEGRRRLGQEELVDLAIRTSGGRTGSVEADVLQPGDAFPVLEVQLVRDAEDVRLVGARRSARDVNEPVRILEWQRPKEDDVLRC
jgi:hypothetical protein